jgi:hypothetical protein
MSLCVTKRTTNLFLRNSKPQFMGGRVLFPGVVSGLMFTPRRPGGDRRFPTELPVRGTLPH